MIDLDASTLELALTAASHIADELDCSVASFVTLPRDVAELALAFTKAAIESLQHSQFGSGRSLN